jgi:hypothetical protein
VPVRAAPAQAREEPARSARRTITIDARMTEAR